MGRPGVGWGGAYVDSWGSGETAGQREAAVHPHFSLHPLFATSPFLTAIRWLPVSRQMQNAAAGGGVGTELIFTFLLEEGGADPLCLQHSLQGAKTQDCPFFSSTPTPLKPLLCRLCPPRRPTVLRNPFKKQDS